MLHRSAGFVVIVVIVVASALLAACGSGAEKPSVEPRSSSLPTGAPTTGVGSGLPLAGSAWQLRQYLNRAGAPAPAAPGKVATLEFAVGGRLNGSTGCNSFSGTYTSEGQRLTIALGPMTRAGCPDPVASQEAAITSGLPNVARYQYSDTDLLLVDGAGVSLFTYTAQDTGISGTAWRVTGVNNGKGAVSSSQQTNRLTATFQANGRFTGFGGCNEMDGPYTTTGTNGLTIGPLASTQKGCAADVMTVESQYAVALSKVATYDISGDTLTLRDGAGATQVSAVRTAR